MALSNETMSNIASALKVDAIKYIEESEDYSEFMFNMLGEFLTLKMGEMDAELSLNIQCMLMDDIYFNR